MMKSLIFMYFFNISLINNFFMMLMIYMPQKSFKFHPMNLMFMMIYSVMMISFFINLLIKSWMNFITILILIGGLLVIFLYISSLANNEFLNWNFKNFLIKFFWFSILMMTSIMFMNKLFPMMIYKIYENNLKFYELYNYFMFTSIFMMIYLYYSLICIMNICYKLNLPLRQIYFYE